MPAFVQDAPDRLDESALRRPTATGTVESNPIAPVGVREAPYSAGQARALAALQRGAGNAAVARMMASRGPTGPVGHRRPDGSGHRPGSIGLQRLDAGQNDTAVPATGPTATGPTAAGPTADAPTPATAAPPGPDAAADPGAIDAPLDESVMVGEGGGGGGGGSGESGSGEKADGPDLATTVRQQNQLIDADAAASEARIGQVEAGHRQRIDGEFAGVRHRLSDLLTKSSATVTGFVASRQAEVRSAGAAILTTGQSLVTSTVQGAQAHATDARRTVTGFVDSATGSLQATVQGVAGRITGLVSGISLPNIPGVAQIRAGITGLANRAAGLVTGGLAQVRTLVDSVVQTGAQWIGSALAELGKAATSALGRATTAISGGMQRVLAGLSQIATAVTAKLRAVVTAAVLPLLARLQRQLTGHLATAKQHAVTAIRANRDEHQRQVAAAAGGSGAGSASADVAAVQAIGADAKQANQEIVQTFTERTGSILGAAFGALIGGAAGIAAQIGTAVTQATTMITAKIGEILQQFRKVADTLGTLLRSMLDDLKLSVTEIIDTVRGLVQAPIDGLLRFASGAVSGVTGFFGRIASSVLSFRLPSLSDVVGEFRLFRGPITKPRPGPITLPGLSTLLILLTLVGALVLYVFPGLALAILGALATIGLSPAAAIIVLGALAILAIALALLLLYLLYKLLTKSPAPKPKPTITHETVFQAPDGSPKSRNDVGVGEKVKFTGSTAGTWSASAGTPTAGTGPTFNWTAPDRGTPVTVTLTTSGGTASETLGVEEPNGINAIKLAENIFPAGTQGAGMLLDFKFQPVKVSFGNVEQREVSGPASNIQKYYLQHGMPHFHNAGPVKFFRITEDNLIAPPVRDRANQSGYPAPWDFGTFFWDIPNKFRVITETGDGKEYTHTKQEFTIADPTGKTTITKAGEKVERTP